MHANTGPRSGLSTIYRLCILCCCFVGSSQAATFSRIRKNTAELPCEVAVRPWYGQNRKIGSADTGEYAQHHRIRAAMVTWHLCSLVPPHRDFAWNIMVAILRTCHCTRQLSRNSSIVRPPSSKYLWGKIQFMTNTCV